MTLLIGLLILGNVVGFQWVIYSSIMMERKSRQHFLNTLNKSRRLNDIGGHVLRRAFERSAFIV